MMIKKNEETINSILEQFNNYGMNIQNVKDYYERRKKDFLDELKFGKKTFDEYDEFYKNNEFEKDNAVKKEKEKNKEIEKILKKLLKKMTQEMLVALYGKSDNMILREEIFNQISSNNSEIVYLNSVCLKSGEIFEKIESMTSEEVERILLLRESNDKIEVVKDNISNYKIDLQSLSTIVIEYFSKKKNGLDLTDEREEFCQENGIENEIQFEFYKKMVINKYIQEQAQEAQEIFNSIIGSEDDSIIKMGESAMSGFTIYFPGKKL